jgi:hypothetical protein
METLSDGGQCLNAAGGSSLSRVLETGPIPPRYFLSPRACANIIRRALKRKKSLPPLLEKALRDVIAQDPTLSLTLVEEPGEDSEEQEESEE